jgi:hypothetical protein
MSATQKSIVSPRCRASMLARATSAAESCGLLVRLYVNETLGSIELLVYDKAIENLISSSKLEPARTMHYQFRRFPSI